MNILGLTISRRKAQQELLPVEPRRGWFRVLESFAGAWQKNVTVDFDCVVAHHAVYACITLIASDIAKLRVMLKSQTADGIWVEVSNPKYSPVLRKPNGFQNRIQFWEGWILSKLMRGNTYVLKQRDNRGVVVALYVLDPCRVRPLVATDGSVFYELRRDDLSGQDAEVVTVPAREIIHDRMNCLFHPLVGTSPIFACGVAATQGLSIQNNQTRFFANRSMPGGILTAPAAISDETAVRLKAAWDSNYSGENAGKVAVLGDGLKFEGISENAVDSQVIDQLKWTGEVVCSTFHVPSYKIGISPMPANSNVQAANLEYFSQALQRLIEDAELCLDEGLDCPDGVGTEFDTDNLLRMDTLTLMDVLMKGAGIMKIDEQRKRLDLSPVRGGDTVYLQQQNFSLEALAKRDAQENPFGTGNATAAVAGIDPSVVLKAKFDAYGVGVRAGAITPQKEDEEAFRSEAGLPLVSGPVSDVWDDEPVRRPITLAGPGDAGAAPTGPVPDDDDEADAEKFIHALVIAAPERFQKYVA